MLVGEKWSSLLCRHGALFAWWKLNGSFVAQTTPHSVDPSHDQLDHQHFRKHRHRRGAFNCILFIRFVFHSLCRRYLGQVRRVNHTHSQSIQSRALLHPHWQYYWYSTLILRLVNGSTFGDQICWTSGEWDFNNQLMEATAAPLIEGCQRTSQSLNQQQV